MRITLVRQTQKRELAVRHACMGEQHLSTIRQRPREREVKSPRKEQLDHNVRMRALVADAASLVDRVREAQKRLQGGDVERINAIASKLLTEPVRYGKPGLQAQITYLAGMTSRGDQKVGRDALDRYAVLRKELDAAIANLNKALGVGKIR